jgi:hypothetical protein
MTPAGYIAKRIESCPDWLNAESVRDIYSVSGCVSEYFCDYIQHWKHNGYWLFDSPEHMEEVAKAESIDLSQHRLFYYEVYEKEFGEDSNVWESFEPERSFKTNIRVPREKKLEGYDVVCFTVRTSPECSPLFCNHLAETIPVNEHCLLSSLEEAVRLIERGAFNNSEPGPYRIFAVYSCDAASPETETRLD